MTAPGAPQEIEILLAAPRGFCAGVDRAVQIVELALQKYGSPVYVRHEIVHNRHVVETLESQGAVFVDELDEVPQDRPVIFSAHGVAKSVPQTAEARKLFYLDATCPLVSKVHIEAERLYAQGHEIILIGHAGHPEVVGTMGQLPEGAIRLVETVEDAQTYVPHAPDKLAFVTQTTLSVDDTTSIVAVLTERFSDIVAPYKEDICYATTNRQEAVKRIAAESDFVLIIGAPNSSNSMRLVEVALRAGCAKARLVQRADEIDWAEIEGARRVGLSAGASAPEILISEVIKAFKQRYTTHVREVEITRETVQFKLPRELRDQT